ncbi:Cytochrome c oxidase [Macleaya cordata]|uniref:Cytochrome c oxidase n=1 Tax=Macleaya cordata TaxID=56857 RepID=A0A200PQK3_MACCD|nr:Cytochrome c oxidase [Macleaya cordata]
MWRRVSALSPWRSVLNQKYNNRAIFNSLSSTTTSTTTMPFHRTTSFFSHQAATDSDAILSKGKKRVEDVMPIATGHEREEIEADLQGRDLTEMDYPEGPFGTKEAPAIIKSTYDKRIVGCPGGEGEDEHDVVWFWLEKGKPHECPVCSQYFKLEVVGPGGSPDGHDDHHDHH